MEDLDRLYRKLKQTPFDKVRKEFVQATFQNPGIISMSRSSEGLRITENARQWFKYHGWTWQEYQDELKRWIKNG